MTAQDGCGVIGGAGLVSSGQNARCDAVDANVRIGNQITQSPKCDLLAGHTGMHRGTILDSDDNCIRHGWSGAA